MKGGLVMMKNRTLHPLFRDAGQTQSPPAGCDKVQNAVFRAAAVTEGGPRGSGENSFLRTQLRGLKGHEGGRYAADFGGRPRGGRRDRNLSR